MPSPPGRSSPARPAPELPERYRVDRHIANGGMAAVWAVDDAVLGRRVAVKVLAEHLAEDETAVERFQREARSAARVSNHPNVVTIYDVGGEGEGVRPFIVMELFAGGSVSARLKRGARPSVEQALAWLEQAAAALDHAHEQEMVHRDIKPGNLLLDDKGRLAVADFGIARLATDQTMTNPGTVLGTAAYLSPEQAAGETASAASDRYALGVVAFELLAGRRPFTAEHFAAQLRAHLDVEPPDASSIRPELPPEVDPILARALAKDPAGRWPTATAMVRALQTALDVSAEPTAATRPQTRSTRPAPARPQTGSTPDRSPGGAPRPASTPRRARPAPVAASAAPTSPPGGLRAARPSSPPPTTPPSPARSRRSFPWLPVAAVLGVLLLAGAAIAAFSGGDDSSSSSSERTGTSARDETQAQDTQAQDTQAQETQATPAPPATTATPAQEEDLAKAEELETTGFQQYQAGKYEAAIGTYQQALAACGNKVKPTDPCAYAHFSLGQSLIEAGRPDEAIPVLEKRLENSNQSGTVQAELDKARKAAGDE